MTHWWTLEYSWWTRTSTEICELDLALNKSNWKWGIRRDTGREGNAYYGTHNQGLGLWLLNSAGYRPQDATFRIQNYGHQRIERGQYVKPGCLAVGSKMSLSSISETGGRLPTELHAVDNKHMQKDKKLVRSFTEN